MKSTGKSHKSTTGKSSSASETRKDRKSSSGMTGSPKKGGHGGKFTWIGHSYSDVPEHEVALDSKDPNFEDREEIIVTATADITV